MIGATFRENLLLGLERTEDEIYHALSLTGLDKLVCSLPLGLATLVGDRRQNSWCQAVESLYEDAKETSALIDLRDSNFIELSGGEKKSLILTRLYLRAKSARLIALDEPTNDLDEQGISSFLRIIKSICEHKTTFIISHDFRMLLQLCDKFLIFNTNSFRACRIDGELMEKVEEYGLFVHRPHGQ